MSGVAGLGVDERRARVVLSLLAEPEDPVTGGLLRRVGALRRSGRSTPTRPGRVRAGSMVRCGETASPHRAGWRAWSSGCAWLRRAGSPP